MKENFRSFAPNRLTEWFSPSVRLNCRARKRGGFELSVRSMGVSYAELGDRLQASRSLAAQQEKAEVDDRITLKSLRACAAALDCELVYAFVPRAISIEEALATHARAAASQTVRRVEHSMDAGRPSEWQRRPGYRRTNTAGQAGALRVMTLFTTGEEIHLSRQTSRPTSFPTLRPRRIEPMEERGKHSCCLFLGSQSEIPNTRERIVGTLHPFIASTDVR